MFNYKFLLELFLLILFQTLLNAFLTILLQNSYLAEIISSVVLAFGFGIIELPFDKAHFYKYPRFYYVFFTTGIMFLLVDLIFFLI